MTNKPQSKLLAALIGPPLFISYLFIGYEIFHISTFSFTYFDAFFLFFVLWCIKRIFWNGDQFKMEKKYFVLCLFVLPVVCMVSSINPMFLNFDNLNVLQYVKSTTNFLYCVSFGIMCSGLDIPIILWINGLRGLIIFAIPINLFGGYQLIARVYDLPLKQLEYNAVNFITKLENPDGLPTQLALNFENFYRATSVFSEPSYLAMYNSTVLMICMVSAFLGSTLLIKNKKLMWTVVICAIIGNFLTFSLTAVVTIASYVGMLFFLEHGGKKKLKIAYSMLFLFFLLIPINYVIEDVSKISLLNLFEQRISSVATLNHSESISGESFFYRASTMNLAVSIWKDSPFFGVGTGMFYYYAPMYYPSYYGQIIYTDSGFIQALTEWGIFGFVFFLGFVVTLLVSSIKERKYFKDLSTDPYIILLYLLPYFGIMLLWLNTSQNSLISRIFWLYAGCSISIFRYFYNKNNAPIYSFTLFATPLKNRFIKNMTPQISTKEIVNE